MEQIKLGMRQYLYYVLIFVLSLCMLIFLPMIGSTQDIGYNVPNTAAGWVVFIITKTIVAVVNVLIFHCFICQAKINIKDNEKFKKANEILEKTKREIKPRSPRRFFATQYGKKGTSVVLFSILSVVALTNAILMFDWISFLTYLLTLIMGVIFGVLEMKTVETFWTEEYYEYAKRLEEENVYKRQHTIQEPVGTSSEEQE